ncbi:hypothetical protein ACOSQ2_029358 [Xanthoceras sorbifolium]
MNSVVYSNKPRRSEDLLECITGFGSAGANGPLFAGLDNIKAWIPHPPRSLKLNTDVTVKVEFSSFGAGIVIRDSMGFVLAASSKPVVGMFSAEVWVSS